MNTVLYSEINIFSIAILLIVAFKAAVLKKNSDMKYNFFAVSVQAAVLANVFDFVRNIAMSEFVDLPMFVILAANFMYFICFGISSYFWFLYGEKVAKSDIFENKIKMVISVLPIVFLAIIILAAMAKDCQTYFNENILYRSGNMYHLQQVLAYGYIPVASLRSFSEAAKGKNYIKRAELWNVAMFVVPPIVCAFAQLIIQSAPIVTLGIVLSYLISFINSLQFFISVDPLTGISNRRELLKTLEEKVMSLKKNEKLYFLFMDIDSFKEINDKYGHNEGDRALKLVAEILQEICKKTSGCCGRYGGDEFALIQSLGHNEDILSVRNAIYDVMEKKNKEQGLAYPVNLSIGCAEYMVDAKSIQELISYADNNMYNKKKLNKQRK